MKKIWDLIKKSMGNVSFRTWMEIIIGIVLTVATIIFISKYTKTQSELNVSQNNATAYQTQLEGIENGFVQFQFTIGQLNYFNDSISRKLKTAIKESKIKDKKIKELQYQLTHFEKTDTVRLTDTIFYASDFILDTTIGDEWMSTELHLEYPNVIGLKTTVVSEKEVIVHSEREYVDTPAKFFICRWMQKKHTVTRVEINENNPNIESTQNVFIKITE